VITNHEESKGKPPRLFSKTGYPSGYPEPALQQKTEEREKRREISHKRCLQCFDAVGWATGRASGL